MSGAASAILVGETPDPDTWIPLPTEDRLMVGGRTVWIGRPSVPTVVSQPNRWGVIEAEFPSVPCIVEIDPIVSGELPMPAEILSWLDRSHRPVKAPTPSDTGAFVIRQARRLANMLNSIRGVTLLASGFARTIPLALPLESADAIELADKKGLMGLRSLPGTAGGIALTVQADHDEETLIAIATILKGLIGHQEQ